ncbi:MAG TPA: serine hydrolase domain-containing protein, partial [Candidatus Dormibacteraeota bacterium]|nr:serine hydrolase domain-containing protein [Candidatus Dormibacteraeota bacterium]
ASLSVSLPNGQFIDVAAGTTAYGGGEPVTPANLFQIGSNTKAFTAALMLKLQSAKKLTVADSVGRWLPQYAGWKDVTIHHMLDMTSGIGTYDDTAAWMKAITTGPYHFFGFPQLVDYVSPANPLASGWHYSNTGYVLSAMIAEKASVGTSYTDLIRSLVIKPTSIRDLYYYPDIYPRELRLRTVQGYYYNSDADSKGLAPLLGKSVRDYSTSWAGPAGGIVATPHAVAQWARDLYQGPILTQTERAQMETLVSNKTGKPIAEATSDDPAAFGLGVAQVYKPVIGRIWFYEGMTLGYRLIHVYFPQQNVVIAFGLNSQPSGAQNHSGDLIMAVAKTLKQNGLL